LRATSRKKDRALYPEYYKELDKDEAEELAAETQAEWDDDDYDPWAPRLTTTTIGELGGAREG